MWIEYSVLIVFYLWEIFYGVLILVYILSGSLERGYFCYLLGSYLKVFDF